MEEGDFMNSVTAWIASSKGPVGNTDFAAELFLCPAMEPQEAELWLLRVWGFRSCCKLKPLIASVLVKQY